MFATSIFINCATDINKTKIVANSDKKPAPIDSLQQVHRELKESFNQDDFPVNEYLTEQLQLIRNNFKRINSIANWTTIKTVDIWETTEGGEAKFYYLNGQLEKIITRHFGETFQLLTEYYLLEGQLSFVFEKSFEYNRPLYYDKKAMQENQDTESFDIDKSEIIEVRSYFNNEKLLHQLNNQDCGSPFAEHYILEEEKRLNTGFKSLINKEI